MEQYIPKSTLVVELKKRIMDYWSDSENTTGIYPYALEEVIKYVDTIEVKEVDLKKELDSFAYSLPHSATGDGYHLGHFDDPRVIEARDSGWTHSWKYKEVEKIAKHFFELGMQVSNKAQKGEQTEKGAVVGLSSSEPLNLPHR